MTESKSVFSDIESVVVEKFRDLVTNDSSCVIFPSILDLEEQLADFFPTLGRMLLGIYVSERLEQAQHAHSKCEKCGEKLELHRNTKWTRGTPFGDIKVSDTYGYCRPCHLSCRPLHRAIGTSRERWSLYVEEAVVDQASDESCGRAVQKVGRYLRGVKVGRTTALRMLHKHGKNAREFVAKKLALAIAKATEEGIEAGGAVELEVEYDGGMIPVATLEPIPVPKGEAPVLTPVRGIPKRHKECRWEEAKVGLVQTPGEVEGRLYTIRPTAELDEAFSDLLALALMKGWTERTEVRGIADGARHIRMRLAEVFHACPFRFILDRPHAKEHLGKAAEELAKLEGVDEDAWAETALQNLEAGRALLVVTELRQASERTSSDILRRAADYFERNQDAVAYALYRDRGWSTASSEVESSHRSLVQVRVKLPGAWWHPDNVPNILALRMIKANGWWDEYWDNRRQAWRERARTFQSGQLSRIQSSRSGLQRTAQA